MTRVQKVGILTFYWADDFGAMLQAYGLKEYVENLGYETDIIPYSNTRLHGRYWILPRGYGDIAWYQFQDNLKHYGCFHRKRKKMKCFRKKYLTSKRFRSEVGKLETRKYDTIIIGSDQVWNPEITCGLNKAYLGEFPIKEGANVISYAPSIGKNRLSKEDVSRLGKAIDTNFAHISLRENSAIAYLQDYCHKQIIPVPDPTFLLTGDEWSREIQDEKNQQMDEDILKLMNGRYVAYYATEINDKMYQFALDLATREHATLINLREIPIGPIEFLKIIRQAFYVVTNSFHGTVFSILFHTNFFVFGHSDKNSRLEDLLINLNLEFRIAVDFKDNHNWPDIDWERVEQSLEPYRKTGQLFLEGNLSRGK